jgi:hypothetical protein
VGGAKAIVVYLLRRKKRSQSVLKMFPVEPAELPAARLVRTELMSILTEDSKSCVISYAHNMLELLLYDTAT